MYNMEKKVWRKLKLPAKHYQNKYRTSTQSATKTWTSQLLTGRFNTNKSAQFGI